MRPPGSALAPCPDGQTDYPADPYCAGAEGQSESPTFVPLVGLVAILGLAGSLMATGWRRVRKGFASGL